MSLRFHLGMTFLVKLTLEKSSQERQLQSQLTQQLQLELEQEMGQTANRWSASSHRGGWLTQNL